LLYLFLLLLISCTTQQEKASVSDTVSVSGPVTPADNKSTYETCWTGTINNKIPVFIHYQLEGNLVVGEIIYLNTKNKTPIALLGTIEEDKNYRLLEFDSTGNITGVIDGKPSGKIFNGSWVSPKTRKELTMNLSSKDTLLRSPDNKPVEGQVLGNYHYRYGEKGYTGNFEINRVADNKIDFSILSLTNPERGYNIAEVQKDTIAMTGNNFIYKIPGSEKCEFKVSFYKEFLYINYTKGYCESQFGLNATIDGIYLKVK
jgi:hypothetical protein